MGRPPCCDKDGIKKGPWTPEEDIILVSYIQQHGPGNWRSVPTNTGLQRCSKSCRLRWTNYLRPGIKRGNFTPHEEGMIIHLQALLGNKWAAIASYLPQRTDNDIKNYWNTHLKKKLKRFQSNFQQHEPQMSLPTTSSPHNNKTINNDDNYHHHHHHHHHHDDHNNSHPHHNVVAPPQSTPSSTCYASSTENISRLLESWMKCGPTSKPDFIFGNTNNTNNTNNSNNNNNNEDDNVVNDHECLGHEEDDHFETMLSFNNFDNNNNNNNHKVGGGIINTTMATTTTITRENTNNYDGEKLHENMDNMDDDDDDENNPQLTFLEKWLLDESNMSRQVSDDLLRLPSIF